jgi:putative Mn2+ efflux pump MntP
VAGTEPVTSPDQHKPTPVKAARIAGVFSIIALLLMTLGNHEGRVEDLFLVATAGIIAALIIIDAVLRRNGLR